MKGKYNYRFGAQRGRGNRNEFKKDIQNDSELKNTSTQQNFVEDLPILDYHGKRNPMLWDDASRRFEVYITRNYGYECGHIFKTGELYEFEDLPEIVAEEYNEDNDPIGIKKLQRMEKEKIRVKKLEKFEDNNKLIYTIVKGQCSASMWNKIKQCYEFEDFDLFLNLELLWERVTEVLLTAAGDNQSEIFVREKAKNDFQAMHQKGFESVDDFYKRFEVEIRSLEAVGVAYGNEDVLAMNFINKLDFNRFASLHAHLQNMMLSGVDIYPTTLAEALTMAENWKVVVPKIDAQGKKTGVVFYSADQKMGKAVGKVETKFVKNVKDSKEKNGSKATKKFSSDVSKSDKKFKKL